jgi:hypothetical protein
MNRMKFYQLSANLYKHCLVLFLALGLWACDGTSPNNNQEGENQNPDANAERQTGDSTDMATAEMRPEVITDIIQSIPSPLEVSYLIKEIGTSYHRDALNNPDFVDQYTNNYKMALNLGIYSTDLGYANIYDKNQDALNYLNAVKKLADGLRIGEFFDYSTIRKLMQNNGNLDSLLQQTTSNFEKINNELNRQKREYLSILILTGGWLEANYLTTLVYKESENEKLKEKIGEQKIVLDKILQVLKVYRSKQNFSGFIADMEELKRAYDNVTINIKVGQPKMELIGNEIVMTDTNETVVTITDQDVKKIASLVQSIRDKLIK